MIDLARALWDNRWILLGLLIYCVLVRATGSLVYAAGIFLAGLTGVLYWWARQRQAQQVKEGMRRSPLWRIAWDISKEEARRAALLSKWARACAGQHLIVDKKTPRVCQLRRTQAGDLAGVISSKSGTPVSDVAQKAGKLAEVIGCKEIVINPTEEGKAEIEFRWSNFLERVVTPADLFAPPAGCISLGRLDSGSSFNLPVVNGDGETIFTPILFGGVSGSGKSSFGHALNGGFIRSGIPYRPWFLDGAGGSEMAVYEEFAGKGSTNPAFTVARYSDNPKEFGDIVKDFHAEMVERAARMKAAGIRLHKPTVEEPLNVLYIDEWTSLPPSLDKIGSILHVVLAQGRKYGFSVVAATQLTEKTVITLRELFVRRICLATMTQEQTTTVLGNVGGIAALAPAHNIPEDQPGVFYMIAAGRKIQKGRVAYYNDPAVAQLARGLLPVGIEEHKPARVEPWVVYWIFRWDAEMQGKVLAYIGKTNDLKRRLAEHAREAAQDSEKGSWWAQAQYLRQMEGHEDAWLRTTNHDSEAECLAAEVIAIDRDCPEFNDLHNHDNPRRKRARRLKVVA
jgi:predicted GIY-YIG superfamily endonuclease